MFFFFPPLKLDDGKVRINAFDARQEGDVHNVDILHVTTTTEDGEELTTHFGIQGRSDHLAEAMGKRDSKQSSDAAVAPAY